MIEYVLQWTPRSWNMGLGGSMLGFPASLGFGVGGRSYSNFLAATKGL